MLLTAGGVVSNVQLTGTVRGPPGPGRYDVGAVLPSECRVPRGQAARAGAVRAALATTSMWQRGGCNHLAATSTWFGPEAGTVAEVAATRCWPACGIWSWGRACRGPRRTGPC